jgi:hypothetical protein
MREINKSKRWEGRMSLTQSLTIERALRAIKDEAAPSYTLVSATIHRTAQKAGRAASLARKLHALLKRLP